MAAASDEIINLAKSHHQFAVDLYKVLCKSHPNLVFCPIIISASLTMLGIGAKGETALQIARLLKIEAIERTSKVHSNFTKLLAALTYKNPHLESFELIIGNTLFIPKGFSFADSFSKTLADRYFVTTHHADFQDKRNEASDDMNTWIASQTRNKITNVVAPSLFDESTKLVLINAVFVKGVWDSRFEPERTTSSTFYLLDGTERQVQMMYQDGFLRCGYNDSLQCRVLEMPYKRGIFAMVFILPDTSDAFRKLEDTLDVDTIEMLLSCVKEGQADVNLWLPQFKADVSTNLQDFLPELGIVDMFSVDSADLSGVCQDRLHVSAISHKAILAVDELGTESSGATVNGCDDVSWRPQPETFNANRPFLYLIRHKKTDAIIFVGRFTSP